MMINSAFGIFYNTDPETIVKKGYDLFKQGDFDKLLGLIDDNAEFILNGNLPTSGHHKGHKNIKNNVFIKSMQLWKNVIASPKEIYSYKDTVFVKGNFKSGKSDSQFMHMHKIKNGKVVYLHMFNDTDALRLAMSN